MGNGLPMGWLTQLLGSIWDFVLFIPGTFWGVIVGSFFSLGGVVLTNRASERRLRDQFVHDRQLRTNEREHALRRDVYLVAAEALAAGIASIGRFTDLETPTADLSRVITEKLPMLSRIQIIGGPGVLEKIITATNELSAVFQRLIAQRIPLSVMKESVRGLEQQIAGFTKHQDNMLELMKTFNLGGEVDQRRWEMIQVGYKFETNRIAEAEKTKADLFAKMGTAQLVYTRECVQELQALGLLIIPAIAAVREELGFPLDEAAYTRTVTIAQEKQMADLKFFLERARQYFNQPTGNEPRDHRYEF